jgi:hypothetical protein
MVFAVTIPDNVIQKSLEMACKRTLEMFGEESYREILEHYKPT